MKTRVIHRKSLILSALLLISIVLKAQINEVTTHFGVNAQTSMNVTWTTSSKLTNTYLQVKNPSGDIVYNQYGSPQSNGSGYSYYASLTGLEPATTYTYTVVSSGGNRSGTFKTASTAESKASLRFVYIADPQVGGNSDAAAAGSNFNLINNHEEEIDFVYIAGDHTDQGTGSQWASLFNAYSGAGRTMFLNHAIASTQGNHDGINLEGRINMPTTSGIKGVYAINYGLLRFIIFNTQRQSSTDKNKQLNFLTQQVNEAKAAGQWVAVGFHKPLYTGGSHAYDDDIKALRTYWSPIFADLDIDMVLAGHDHVYSRGFVRGDHTGVSGANKKTGEPVLTYYHVTGAPLHMVGGHAGGLKWYSGYNFSYLDKNSATEYPPSSQTKEQTYIVVEVTADKATFTAYNSKYGSKPRYVYDKFVVLKNTYNTRILTYISDGAGTISGETSQTVSVNGSGTEVEAVANEGYHFVKWSDGVTTAKRTDKNVTNNITVTAEFAINTYALTYNEDGNGTIQGEATQTVNHNGSGTEVKAVANGGYHFVQWSDGKI
ncbi:MAG: metallophosphoesterase family protein, partial [Bacteroidales bacterium]|nr:metallophosphoesterase family protein [Bacteroidales bacterium]